MLQAQQRKAAGIWEGTPAGLVTGHSSCPPAHLVSSPLPWAGGAARAVGLEHGLWPALVTRARPRSREEAVSGASPVLTGRRGGSPSWHYLSLQRKTKARPEPGPKLPQAGSHVVSARVRESGEARASYDQHWHRVCLCPGPAFRPGTKLQEGRSGHGGTLGPCLEAELEQVAWFAPSCSACPPQGQASQPIAAEELPSCCHVLRPPCPLPGRSDCQSKLN